MHEREKADILREALFRLEQQTPIKATAPGNVARAFTEAVTEQLGDMYDAMDFNLAQSVISTATGRALDLLGELYGIRRKTLSDLAATDARVGAFYFYVDSTYGSDITIPVGTKVYTGIDSFIGKQLAYSTSEPATIRAGRTKVWVSIRPDFSTGVFTAAANTLNVHNFTSPAGTSVRCTNPKPIAPQFGYETDSNYRIRVIKSIRVASSGTAEAVRFAGLNIRGIRDIKIRQAPYGMGSFESLIIPEDPNDIAIVYPAAKAAMDRVRPVGVRMLAKRPSYILVDISATIVLSSTLVSPNIADMVKVSLLRYLNSLLPGDVLVYNKLVQEILDVSNAIKDVRITKYAPRGVEAVRRNYLVQEDEQLIPGRIDIVTAS